MNSFDKPNLENLFPLPEKFRVAVCLSGQARHWKTAVSNIRQFFETNQTDPTYNLPVNVDYFVHTWDTNTWRYAKTAHNHFYNEPFSDIDGIVSAFQPKGYELQKWHPLRFKRAWDSMFYSHAKSLMLKREYELEQNFQYDIVVKCRLDVVYNPRYRMCLNRVMPKVCYSLNVNVFPIEFNYYNFDDVIFYGDSPTMDLVGDLYSTYRVKHSDEHQLSNSKSLDIDQTLHYGPGCLLYDHMMHLGVHPERRHTFDYAVVRSTAVNENLDGITDYDRIKQKWIEWYV